MKIEEITYASKKTYFVREMSSGYSQSASLSDSVKNLRKAHI
jgi:hypothetical protein